MTRPFDALTHRVLVAASILLSAAVARAESAAPPGASGPAAPVKDYNIVAKISPTPPAANSAATLEVTITPKGNYVLKTDTPFKAALKASGGVKLEKAEFAAKDFVDAKTPHKTIKTTLIAAAGKQSVEADLTFFLCTPEMCQRFKDKLSVEVAAK